MKKTGLLSTVIIGLAFALSIGACGIYLVNRQHEQPFKSPEKTFVEFWDKHYKDKPGYSNVAEVSFWTAYYAEPLGLRRPEDHLPAMLSMWHRESALQPQTDDTKYVGKKKRSLGVTQVRESYQEWVRARWRLLGIELGPSDEIRTQCAFGVMMYHYHLGIAKGNVDEAVGRYNAGKNWNGNAGKEYRRRVFVSRKKIFGTPEPERK